MVSWFSVGVCVLACVLGGYVSLERSAALHSRERETGFWLAFLTSACALLVFGEGSPVRGWGIPEEAGVLARAGVVFVVAPLVGGFVLSRNKIKELGQAHDVHLFSRRASIHAKKRGGAMHAAARFKQGDLDELVDRLAYASHVRFFVSYIMGRVQERRQRIRQIVHSSSLDELNHLLLTINVAKLLHFADMDLFNTLQDNPLLMHLSVASKSTIIHSLMRIQGLFHPRQRELVVALLLSESTPEGFRSLKNKLDASGDSQNLYKLVYGDFGADPNLQGKVMQHVRDMAADSKRTGGAKILSDIDDTFFSSGGRWPAGLDKSWPRHALYPGVLTFYEELDRHAAGGGGGGLGKEETGPDSFLVSVDLLSEQVELDLPPGTTLGELAGRIETEYLVPHWRQRWSVQPSAGGVTSSAVDRERGGQNLVFLSARPHAYKDLTEASSYARFRALFERGKLHTRPTLLPGDLRIGARVVWEDMSTRVLSFLYDARALCSALALVAEKKVVERQRKQQGGEGENKVGLPPRLKELLEMWASSEPGDAVDELEKKSSSAWEAVGAHKAATFLNFCALYPECTFCFVGDDGQGDVLAAEMVAEKLGRDVMRASFIHRVMPRAAASGPGATTAAASDVDAVLSTLPPGPAGREKRWKELGIHFFDTYVGAAAIALDEGLLHPRGAYRVGVAARDEMLEYMIDQPDVQDWSGNVAQLNRDIDRVNEAIARATGGSKLVVPRVEGKGGG